MPVSPAHAERVIADRPNRVEAQLFLRSQQRAYHQARHRHWKAGRGTSSVVSPARLGFFRVRFLYFTEKLADEGLFANVKDFPFLGFAFTL